MNKALVPQIRFKGFTYAWELKRLDDLGVHYSTGNLGYADIVKNGQYKCILYGELYTKYNEIIKEVFSRTNRIGTIAQPNDILFPTSTTVDSQSLISPSCINVENTVVGGDLFGLRLYKNVDGNFISYYLNGNSKIKLRLSQRAQGLTIIHIHFTSIKDILLCTPQLPEQNKIAQTFSTLDSLLTLHQRKCDALKKIKQTLLEKMFPVEGSNIPSIRFAGFTYAWELKRLDDLGVHYSTGNLGYADIVKNGQYKCILYGELYTKYNEIIKEVFSRTNRIGTIAQPNDILFPTSTTVDSQSLISPSCINVENTVVGGDLFGLRLYKNVDGNFISYYLNGNSKIKLRLSQRAQGLTIIHIHFTSIKDILLCTPQLPEQNKIAQTFSTLDSLLTLHQRKCEKLKKIKQELLNKMFV